MQNFKETFNKVLTDTLNIDEEQITPDTRFEDELGVDSLDMVELIMEFERVFQISSPDEAADEIKTVSDAENYIRLKLATTK